MKHFLLYCLLILGACSSTHFYQSAELKKELATDKTHLKLLVSKLVEDFNDKQRYYHSYFHQTPNQESFIAQDLAWRMEDLTTKKQLVLAKAKNISKIHQLLFQQLDKKEKIKEGGEIFLKVTSYVQTSKSEVDDLFQHYIAYMKASTDFHNFAFLTQKKN
jgi:hypothetical protein